MGIPAFFDKGEHVTKYLRDAIEMHVHTSPDVTERKCTDTELAQRVKASGMAGALIKSHYGETAARAALLRERYPELIFAGGITLNLSVGGINPAAVKACGQMGGRFVWFPTMDARHYQAFQKRNNHGSKVELSEKLYILQEDGRLIPEALKVLDMAARYHMVVATGHISAAEGMALTRAAREMGCQMVLTHADNPADCYSLEEQREAVRMGALVEHCYFTTYYHRTPIEEIAEQIRAVGCENVYLSTDFGQLKSPYFDEGLEEYGQLLAEQGFGGEELRIMMHDVPLALLQENEVKSY